MSQGPQESFFAPVRGSLAAIVTLSLIGAASSVVPFIAIVELARTLLPAIDGGPVDAGRVWTIVIVAVVALFVSAASAFGAGAVGHFADGRLQLSLRQRIVRHLQRLPLGWFDQRSSGTVRKLVESDVTSLHQLVAHTIQDLLTAIAVPVIGLVYLFGTGGRFSSFRRSQQVAACGQPPFTRTDAGNGTKRTVPPYPTDRGWWEFSPGTWSFSAS
ncbi:ABC transporter transmembrane domain-containing protein [Micropruina sp.]|uniref:ABC transporter transmembrane domain-containing protein n=1 Tax=Micropruina sp. TaxID=2737536 RepID=UPI0039E2FF47